ncbi:MAG: hypothetical protein KW802_00385 [Candidatus Doudnabacteria bacterium]|nr:hypothetical protein [Candidatus Doudnabacteria bacterium]
MQPVHRVQKRVPGGAVHADQQHPHDEAGYGIPDGILRLRSVKRAVAAAVVLFASGVFVQ